MKIVIDARILTPGSGIGRTLSHLLPSLEALDSVNHYVVILQNRNYDLYQPQNPNFSKVLANYRHFGLSEQIQFCWLLYRLRADLVHFPYVNHPIFYFKPKIISVLDLTLVDFKNIRQNVFTYNLKYWAFRLVLNRAINSASHLIVTSRYVRGEVLKRYRVKKTKITVAFPAVEELATHAKIYPSMVGKDFLLYVGAAYPYKNLALLIEAFGSAQKQKPELYLVLAGNKDWFYQNLDQQAQAKGIKNLVFAGFVPDPQLRWLYQNAKAYVFPSLSEGFGLPGLEAMAHGLPVIAARASCLPEIYGPAALYFNPSDSSDLAKKISELINSQPLRQQLITAGKTRIKQYSWTKMAKQILVLYEQAGNNR